MEVGTRSAQVPQANSDQKVYVPSKLAVGQRFRICPTCGNAFRAVYQNDIYCGRKCYQRARKHMPR